MVALWFPSDSTVTKRRHPEGLMSILPSGKAVANIWPTATPSGLAAPGRRPRCRGTEGASATARAVTAVPAFRYSRTMSAGLCLLQATVCRMDPAEKSSHSGRATSSPATRLEFLIIHSCKALPSADWIGLEKT
jgi:hypothetical protein